MIAAISSFRKPLGKTVSADEFKVHHDPIDLTVKIASKQRKFISFHNVKKNYVINNFWDTVRLFSTERGVRDQIGQGTSFLPAAS